MSDPLDSQFLDDSEFQSLLVGCLESLQRGETIDRVALAKDFPHFADEIGRFLDDRQLLEQVASNLDDVKPSRVAVAAYAHTMDSNSGPRDFAPGETIRYIGEYEILGEIARGGMGIVFKAQQQKLNRTVALKMILAGRLADSADVERFYREARAAGRLSHPNIVPVHEVGEHDGRHYFTMDYVEGCSLAETIREETLAPRDAAALVRTTAEAVHYAHEQGTVHRDLKPANILLDGNRQPKVTDFGLAKMLSGLDDHTRAELTASGQILGTPSYMSPEQASGKQELVGPASDIYSLGAILYASLTGRAPFVADSPVDTLLQVMNKDPVSPRDLNPSVPKDLETICLKCLTKEPHKRYGTASLLAEDLGNFLEGRPVRARPVGRVQRGWRWCRRNPMVASLLILCASLLVGGSIVSTHFAWEADARADAESEQRRRADKTVDLLHAAKQEIEIALDRESRALADTQIERDEARRQRHRAEVLLYATRLNAANDELAENRIQSARESLDHCLAEFRDWEHDYLSALVADQERGEADVHVEAKPSVQRLPDALQGAAAMAVSPNGSRAVVIRAKNPSSARSTDVPVIHVDTGAIAGWMVGHQSRVSSATYRPDGTCLVTGADDGTIKVWDAKTYHELFELPGFEESVTSLAFSPDGSQVVCASGQHRIGRSDGNISRLIVYDFQQRKQRWRLDGHSGLVTTAVFSPDGKWIASGGFGIGVEDPGEVRLWDARTGEAVFSVEGPPIAVTRVAFAPDSQRLAVAGGAGVGEKEVLLLDVPTGESVFVLPEHSETIFDIAFSPNGNRIATLGGTLLPADLRRLTLWDARTGIELLQLDAGANLNQVTWHPKDSKMVGLGSANQRSVLVTLRNDQQQVLPDLVIRRGTESAASSLAFAPDGREIVSGGQYQVVHLWDVRTGEEIRPITRHSKPVMAVDISGDGNRIASASLDGVRVWDRTLDREVLAVDGKGYDLRFYSVACSPDGYRVAAAGSGGQVHLWSIADDLQTRRLVLPGHTGTVRDVVFSADGSRIATAGSDNTIRVWEVESGEQLHSLKAHDQVVTCVAFSPDGKQLVSGSFDKTLRIWDVENGHPLAELVGHNHSVLCVAFGPDGTHIVSGGADKTIRLWRADSGELLKSLVGHDGYVRSVVLSPDGSLIASSAGAEDMTIRLWPNPIAP